MEKKITIGFADWQWWGLYAAFYPLVNFLIMGYLSEIFWLMEGIVIGWGTCRFFAHYFEWSITKLKQQLRKKPKEKEMLRFKTSHGFVTFPKQDAR